MNMTTILRRVQTYMQSSDNNGAKSLPSLPFVVEEARQEWLNAQYYYNTVTDQDLIDHAVYLMQAAEKKYMYLLKQARRAGVVYSPYMATADGDVVQNEIISK